MSSILSNLAFNGAYLLIVVATAVVLGLLVGRTRSVKAMKWALLSATVGAVILYGLIVPILLPLLSSGRHLSLIPFDMIVHGVVFLIMMFRAALAGRIKPRTA